MSNIDLQWFTNWLSYIGQRRTVTGGQPTEAPSKLLVSSTGFNGLCTRGVISGEVPFSGLVEVAKVSFFG